MAVYIPVYIPASYTRPYNDAHEGRSEIRNDAHTMASSATFDRRIAWPYIVAIGHISSYKHQTWGFYITAPCIMQVAH